MTHALLAEIVWKILESERAHTHFKNTQLIYRAEKTVTSARDYIKNGTRTLENHEIEQIETEIKNKIEMNE